MNDLIISKFFLGHLYEAQRIVYWSDLIEFLGRVCPSLMREYECRVVEETLGSVGHYPGIGHIRVYRFLGIHVPDFDQGFILHSSTRPLAPNIYYLFGVRLNQEEWLRVIGLDQEDRLVHFLKWGNYARN